MVLVVATDLTLSGVSKHTGVNLHALKSEEQTIANRRARRLISALQLNASAVTADSAIVG